MSTVKAMSTVKDTSVSTSDAKAATQKQNAAALADTPGGTQWYSALQAKAQAAVAGIFTTTLYPIQEPAQGDIKWNYQNNNLIFNQGTWDFISANVSPGLTPGTAQLSTSGGFPNDYVQVVSKIAYSLSSADLAAVNAAKQQASVQAQTMVSDYQGTYGPITAANLATAQAAVGTFAVQTSQDYILSYVLGYLWSGAQTAKTPPVTYKAMAAARNLSALLPQMPGSGNTVVADAASYLSMLQPVNVIQSNQQLGAWIIAQLVGNTSTPTSNNGGISTVDPNTGAVNPNLQVAYGIAQSLASISNDLANTGRTISIDMQTSSASGSQVNVSVSGQTEFSVGDWLTFTVTAGASYSMSKAQGTSTDATVSIDFKGYSVLSTSPLAWQQATNQGWFYGDPIAQAVVNGTQDVTGFKFLAPPVGINLGAFADGGNFGLLNNLLISNYPTITITYQNADFSSFQENWSESVSGNVSLFGWISLGSFSQGAYGSSYNKGSDNSTFSVTFAPSPQVTSLPQMMQQAYIIGGAVTNPGVNSSSEDLIAKLSAPQASSPNGDEKK